MPDWPSMCERVRRPDLKAYINVPFAEIEDKQGCYKSSSKFKNRLVSETRERGALQI